MKFTKPHFRFFLVSCFLAQVCRSLLHSKHTASSHALRPLQVSTFDYQKLASDVALGANALRNQIAWRPPTDYFQPHKEDTSDRLSEPLPVEFKKKLKASDILPFAVTGSIAAGLSLLFDSTIPAQIILANEAIFLAFCAGVASANFSPPTRLEEVDMSRRWETILDNMLESVSCPREFLTEWFIDAKFEDIRREDAEEFMAWAIYSTLPEYLNDSQMKAVHRTVGLLEVATSSPKLQQQEQGKSSSSSSGTLTRHFPLRMAHEVPLRSMRHSIEPLRWTHKPFMLYFLLQVVCGVMVRRTLSSRGFAAKSAGKLNYWIKNTDINTATTNTDTNVDHIAGMDMGISSQSTGSTLSLSSASLSVRKPPIVFFHGIGGMFSYLKLVDGLTLFGHPMVVVELPYVSLHIAPDIPSIKDHVDAFRAILDDNDFDGAILVGHSFGTKVMSWLVQAMPEKIAGAVFLDPVVFMLHLSDLIYNWMYQGEQQLDGSFHDLHDMFGIVKTELFAVRAVSRKFFWSQNALWAHELQDHEIEALVLVSSDDKIVPSQEVSRHIREHVDTMLGNGQHNHVAVEVLEGAGHGSLVFEDELRLQVLTKIKVAVDRSYDNWAEKRCSRTAELV